MKRANVFARVHATAVAVRPGLRVVGLTYTGIVGMLAMGLVAVVAFTPVAPVLEPAGQVAATLVHPAGDAIVVLMGGPSVHVDAPPEGGSSLTLRTGAELRLDVVVVDAEDDGVALSSSDEVVERQNVPSPLGNARLTPDQEDLGVDGEEAPMYTIDHTPPVQIVAPAEPPMLQAAAEDVRPLAPLPTPSPTPIETPAQIKARLEVENQVAIEAARAAQARAKAEAAAANRAAIEALRASATTPTTAATQTPAAPPATVVPSVPSTPQPTAKPPTKAAVQAANQAAIEAARGAHARVKADANAANQAAVAAAKGVKSPATPRPTPPTPTASATPTAQPMPTPTASAQAAAAVICMIEDVEAACAASDATLPAD